MAGAGLDKVRLCGIDARIGRLLPACIGGAFGRPRRRGFACRGDTGEWADTRALVRRQDGEADSMTRQQIQRLQIDRRLRQPHAFRLAAVAVLEVGNAPHDLRFAVPCRGKRHDDVVVGLRHGRAVSAKLPLAQAVGIANHRVGEWRLLLHPGEQRWPEVEAHPRVVVGDAQDAVLAVDDACRAIRRIALRRDALIPVVVRRSGVLGLDGFEPRILARRLIKVSVNADKAVSGRDGHAGLV